MAKLKNSPKKAQIFSYNQLKPQILDFYKKELTSIKELIKKESHFLIFCQDRYLLDLIINQFNETFVNLDLEKNMKKIYQYLESEDLKIFFSSRVTCIDEQERRNRSRFNHKIVYLKPLSLEKYEKLNGLAEEYKIDFSVKHLFKRNLQLKYKIEDERILYDVLTPLHFVILSIYGKNFDETNLKELSHYKIMQIKQLSKFDFPIQIIEKRIQELKDMGFFNKLVERKRMEDLKNFVNSNCCLYLKELFSS